MIIAKYSTFRVASRLTPRNLNKYYTRFVGRKRFCYNFGSSWRNWANVLSAFIWLFHSFFLFNILLNIHRCRCGWIKWNRTFQLNWHSKIYIWHRSFRFLSCFSDTPQFAVLFNGQSKIWIFLSLVSLGSLRADIQRATKMDVEKWYFWVKWSIKLQSIKFGWPTLVDSSTPIHSTFWSNLVCFTWAEKTFLSFRVLSTKATFEDFLMK